MRTGLIPTLVPALLLIGLGAWIASCFAGEVQTVVEERADTVNVDNPVLVAMIEDLELERDGWKARFEGVRELEPRTIIRADTVLATCPDVTYTAGSIDEHGQIRFGRLDRVAGGYRPQLQHVVPPGNCDDGLSFGAQGVLCDPARLGHLEVYGAPGLLYGRAVAYPLAELGISWAPSFRGTFRMDLGLSTVEGGAAIVRIRKGVRLF